VKYLVKKFGKHSSGASAAQMALRGGIRSIVVLTLAASGNICAAPVEPGVLEEPAGWDCTAWRKVLPSIQLSDVAIEVAAEKEVWDYLSQTYSLQPNRIIYWVDFVETNDALKERANRTFSFSAESCTVADILDAIAARYDLKWIQDEKTGVLWAYPAEFDLERFDRITVEIERPLVAVPMRSEILDQYIDRRTLGSMRLDSGPSGYYLYHFVQYAVDIPRGTHSLREVLNLACSSSPTQFFEMQYMYTPASYPATETKKWEQLTIYPDSIRSQPSPANEVLAAYASRYLGVADGANVDAETLGQRLSSPDPAKRRSAQHYVELTELKNWKQYQPHEELSLIQNLWYALACDRYDKMSQEGFPRVSPYIQENVSDEFLLSCPDSHLVLLLGLERARIERDFSWLKVLQGRTFKPEELAGLEHEVLYIARRCGVIWNALRQPESEYFIATGGWAASFMEEDYPEPYDGPYRKLDQLRVN